MPLPLLGAGIGAAGSLLQGFMGNRAAREQRRAAEANSRLIGQRYDQTRGDFQPYMSAGTDSLSQLQSVNSGDYTGFMQSPDYLAARDMGLEGVDRQAAARGLLGSGGTDADRISFAGNLATQNLNNYRSSLMGVAGLGANMTGNLGGLGASYTGMQTGQNTAAGQARASGYGAWGNALGGIGAIGGDYFGYQGGAGGGVNSKYSKGGI